MRKTKRSFICIMHFIFSSNKKESYQALTYLSFATKRLRNQLVFSTQSISYQKLHPTLEFYITVKFILWFQSQQLFSCPNLSEETIWTYLYSVHSLMSTGDGQPSALKGFRQCRREAAVLDCLGSRVQLAVKVTFKSVNGLM